MHIKSILNLALVPLVSGASIRLVTPSTQDAVDLASLPGGQSVFAHPAEQERTTFSPQYRYRTMSSSIPTEIEGEDEAECAEKVRGTKRPVDKKLVAKIISSTSPTEIEGEDEAEHASDFVDQKKSVAKTRHEGLTDVEAQSIFRYKAQAHAQTEPGPEREANSPHPANFPLLIWHGLGDAFDAAGIKSVAALYQKVYPGSKVYSIHLGEDTAADRQASWLGDVNEQIEQVCAALGEEFKKRADVNALGFSQGGQFLRGVVERCGGGAADGASAGAGVNVRNLVTVGSQHNGISAYQDCQEGSWFCTFVNNLARGSTWGWAQRRLVPAQYFRDTADLESYLGYSNFLADVNNEREAKNSTYRENLQMLDRFVMIMFEDDTTVVPKESSWFADVDGTSGVVIPLREREMYKEDWVGLRALDERGRLVFEGAEGRHMNVTEGLLRRIFGVWFEPEGEKGSVGGEDL